jgi:hypothetical protein
VKSAVVLLSLGLLLALGAVGVLLVSNPHDSGARATDARSASADTGAPAAGGDSRSADVLQRLDGLSREVDVLREELAAIKSSAGREPAVEVAAAPQPVDDNSAMFAAEHRNAIMKVIEEDREAQKRKADDEQRARDLAASLARAERTAKQFGLAQDQQKALADIYIAERQKMDEIRNQFQGNPGGDPEAMRTSFRELRDWRLSELTLRLGADLGEKINEADQAGFRGGFGGPGGGGGGGRRGGNRNGGGDNGNGGNGGGE